MADYIFKTITFVDNQGGTSAENVTSSIVNLYHQIPLIGDSNDGTFNKKVNNEAYLELHFGVGEYIIDHSILMRCNLVVTGEGVDKTKIRFTRTFNTEYEQSGPGHAHCYEWDAAFISVKGQKEREVSVEVTNLTMEMDYGTNYGESEILLVKIGHANKVLFRNVNSRYDNCKAHNLNLEVCSNITIENCKFTAYNNLSEGAIMSIRGNTENVTILNNEFHKHGNDEMLTFFGYIDDLSDKRQITLNNNEINVTAIPHNNFKRNILIEGNSFNYDSASEADATISGAVHKIDVVLSIYDFDAIIYPSSDIVEDNNLHKIKSEIKDIKILNNQFVANDAPVGTWVSFSFSSYVEQSGIAMEDNLFSQGSWTRPSGVGPLTYRKNITVNDNSFKSAPIVIKNNELINNDVSWVTYNSGTSYETRHCFICTHGGNLIVEGNRIIDLASGGHYQKMTFIEMEEMETAYSSRDFEEKNQGVGLIAIIKENHIEGMQRLALFAHIVHPLVCMKLLNNYIKGGAYLNVQDVERIDLTMEGNEIHSTASQLLFKGSPNDGNLVLNRNNVYNEYRTPWSSSIMEQPFFVNYDWTQNENLDMNIKYLQVIGNAFNDFGGTVFNVAVYDMMPSGCLRVISGNTY